MIYLVKIDKLFKNKKFVVKLTANVLMKKIKQNEQTI
jgi:hypothetical protein